MRIVPDEMNARIASGAATLCHVWILRAGETVLGFTDHDRILSVEGVDCRPEAGWRQGATTTELGLTPGQATADGVLGADGLAETDIAGGRLDGARVELFRVDWGRPALKVRLWAGTLTRIRRAGGGFEVELEGPMAALERVVGRTYGRLCDAVLGDARCRAEPGGRTCDKRYATCSGTFGNGANFQGFPHLPGEDFLTAHPATGRRNDGGSRRS